MGAEVVLDRHLADTHWVPGVCKMTSPALPSRPHWEGGDLYSPPAGCRVGAGCELHLSLEPPERGGKASDAGLVLSAPQHCLASTQSVMPITSKGNDRGPVSAARRAVRH